jgi:hypothetical protein
MPPADGDRPPLPFPIVEGVDYYVEDGRWVFTARYHLRRGYCCGSGCRHCPYGDRVGDQSQQREGGDAGQCTQDEPDRSAS